MLTKVKGKWSNTQFDIFFYFLYCNAPSNKCHKQKFMCYFYIHQTSGACSVNCTCNCKQNSAGTRCHGFLVLESWCHGFLVMESWCCGFMSSEKMPWSHDVAYLSPFLDVVFSSPNISVTVFWLWNLDVVFFLVLESRCCGIFVSTASFSFSSWKQKNHA